MAELDGTKRIEASHKADVQLWPEASEAASQDISTSRSFTVAAGEYWTVVCQEAFFLATHASAATASAASLPLPAGMHSGVIPTGITKLAIFSSVPGAKGAGWKS